MTIKKKNAQLVFADAMLDIIFYTRTVNEQLVVELRQFKGPNTESMIIATNEAIEEAERSFKHFKRLRQEATIF